MTKKTALIIEDEPKQGGIFSTVLQSVGYETELICDGQAALKRLVTVVPAIIILDLHLPQISGYDILAQIQADHRLDETYVVVVTADTIGAEKLKDQGILVLVKPVSIQQLLSLGTIYA